MRHSNILLKSCLSTVISMSIFICGMQQASCQGFMPIYKNPKAPIKKRVDDLFSRLTQDEKLSMLTGTGFTTQPIPRLGVPAMGMVDGPQGVRGGSSLSEGPATQFPSSVALAATWDTALIKRVGAAIGRETLNKGEGANIILGPCVNIHRSPLGGRNYESFSEDPYLAAQMAVAYIEGVQSQGAAACVKHFACNNQEFERGTINVKVDERALREIYLPAFEAAVKKAHVCSLMTSYNCINGPHASANRYLVTDILKNEWGFDGLVMSDWYGVHETAAVVNAGNDLEMPGGGFLVPAELKKALDRGEIKQSAVDESVRRIVRTVIRTRLLDKPVIRDNKIVDCNAHRQLAKEAASEAIVLLKNKRNTLPLDATKIKSIAIIGPNADANPYGMGSGHVSPSHYVSALKGIENKVAGKVEIKTGCLSMNGDNFKEAIDAAKSSDVAIVVAGLNDAYEGETKDRESLNLPENQTALIEAVAAANKNTVVVNFSGTPVLMNKWLKQVPSIIQAWYTGEEAGSALADVLFGDVNPSGKLPDTFGYKREDYPDYNNFPGKNGIVNYEEGIYVGYRHFDKAHIKPMFPFGHGLSYTTFEYKNLVVPKALKKGLQARISATIKNTGRRQGEEVVQLYIHDNKPKVDRSIKELKSFKRVALRPGESKKITFTISESDFAYYNVDAGRWVANNGSYEIEIGSSSRDIRLNAPIILK